MKERLREKERVGEAFTMNQAPGIKEQQIQAVCVSKWEARGTSFRVYRLSVIED